VRVHERAVTAARLHVLGREEDAHERFDVKLRVCSGRVGCEHVAGIARGAYENIRARAIVATGDGIRPPSGCARGFTSSL
jgi:hypothetical protein